MTSVRSSMMKVSVVVCLVLSSAQTFAASIYNVEIYDGFDPGWSMDGGTISTNGFLGTTDDTARSDVDVASVWVDWSIRYTSPLGSYELTPANSEVSSEGRSGPTFTADEIFMEPDISEGSMTLTTSSGQAITWFGRDFDDPFGVPSFDGGGVGLRDGVEAARITLGFCDPLDTQIECLDQTLVATIVPEPKGTVIAVVLLLVALRNQRRSHPLDRL